LIGKGIKGHLTVENVQESEIKRPTATFNRLKLNISCLASQIVAAFNRTEAKHFSNIKTTPQFPPPFSNIAPLTGVFARNILLTWL